MSKFTIRRRFPNHFSGFEETEHEIDTREELEQIDWVNNATSYRTYHTLAVSRKTEDYETSHKLMVLNDYSEEFGGCKSWWVIGYIIGDPIDELELPEWTTLIGDHKDGCPQKKWQHDECNCGFK